MRERCQNSSEDGESGVCSVIDRNFHCLYPSVMSTGNSELMKELRLRIKEKGEMTFEEFMDMVLYHPEYGYYMSKMARIGKEGDYYTSTDVHKAFGGCIMRQIEEMQVVLGQSPLNIVEVGAGKGLLCLDILLSAQEKAPELFETIKYFIIEKSPDFIERQRKRLEGSGLSDKVSWVGDFKEALPDGIGIVISNELIDAFPVHKVRFSNGLWEEIYVTLKDDELVEIGGSPAKKEIGNFLARLPGPFEEGYTTEVNLRGVVWIKGVGNNLDKGFVITIDYGYPRMELYSPERNRGTLMCYHKHQASEDPYVNIGEQDLTAHVDFTSLAEAGREGGLEITGFTDQTYFLMGCGIEEEFQKIEKMDESGLTGFGSNLALKKLLMPGGMGSTFKVLIQHKGVERPRLRGFSFKNTARYLIS